MTRATTFATGTSTRQTSSAVATLIRMHTIKDANWGKHVYVRGRGPNMRLNMLQCHRPSLKGANRERAGNAWSEWIYRNASDGGAARRMLRNNV